MESFEEIGNRTGTDKVLHHGYHRFYPLFLERYREATITMLEIGIADGSSLRLWEAYFPKARMYGIDISQGFETERGRIFRGRQADIPFLDTVIRGIGTHADLVIDDGSHKPEDQIATFNHLFCHLLAEGGTYIIEDIETSYWEHGYCYDNLIEKGYRHPSSVIEIFKHVPDCVNREFLKTDAPLHRLPVPVAVQRQIAAITFVQNAIIILKKNETFSKYDNREYRFRAMLDKH